MGNLLEWPHLVIIALIAFLLFGAKRLPVLGKGLGEGLKGFKEGMKGITDPAPSAPAPQAPVQQAAVSNVPQSASPGKANYRCPSCKNILSASAPNPNAAEDKGFCPECGTQFDKKAAQV